MDRNALHHTIPIGSYDWIFINGMFVLGCLIVFLLSYKASAKRLNWVRYGLVGLLSGNFVVNQVFALVTNTWQKEVHLPFHLCSFSVFLAIYTLLKKSQWSYEFLIFWSSGAIHAFITPEITGGYSLYNLWEYLIGHGGVIIAAFFSTIFLKFEARPRSWFKVFLLTQFTLPFFGFFNWWLDANYMFISQKPNVNNPFIIGEWPYYIIGLEFAVLLHFYAFNWIHKRVGSVKWI